MIALLNLFNQILSIIYKFMKLLLDHYLKN